MLAVLDQGQVNVSHVHRDQSFLLRVNVCVKMAGLGRAAKTGDSNATLDVRSVMGPKIQTAYSALKMQ